MDDIIQAFPTDDANFMTSIAKGLAVIRAFDGRKKRLTIAQVSNLTGFSRASVMRCLHTLSVLGYVSVHEHNYTLLPKILTLGHAYLSSNWLTISAEPYLEKLSGLVQEACSMAVLNEGDILYIARAAISDRIISTNLSVGSRLPAYCTSMGRVLLSELNEQDLNSYFQHAVLQARTKKTIYHPEILREQLVIIRQQGFATVEQEYEANLRSIAAPIRDNHGQCIAAINISTHSKQVSKEKLEKQFLPLLLATCSEISHVISLE